jgi:hypothetical protein
MVFDGGAKLRMMVREQRELQDGENARPAGKVLLQAKFYLGGGLFEGASAECPRRRK